LSGHTFNAAVSIVLTENTTRYYHAQDLYSRAQAQNIKRVQRIG
jgi:hypothetical protein